MNAISKLAMFCLLPLAFALGCGGTEGDMDPTTDTFEATIHMVAPNAIVGNFYMGYPPCEKLVDSADYGYGECGLVCKGVSECSVEFPDAGLVKVIFQAPNILAFPHLLKTTGVFIPPSLERHHYASDDPHEVSNGSTAELDWSREGSWGMAPNGDYLNNFDGEVRKVRTWFAGEHILIDLDLNIRGTVQGLSFIGQSFDGCKLSGEITDDLKSINYELVTLRTTYEGTLTRME